MTQSIHDMTFECTVQDSERVLAAARGELVRKGRFDTPAAAAAHLAGDVSMALVVLVDLSALASSSAEVLHIACAPRR